MKKERKEGNGRPRIDTAHGADFARAVGPRLCSISEEHRGDQDAGARLGLEERIHGNQPSSSELVAEKQESVEEVGNPHA